MQAVVKTGRSKYPLRRIALPSVAGTGLTERIRSTTFALLGLAAAVGLGLVALFAQPGFPLLSPAPLPNEPHVALEGSVALGVPADASAPVGVSGLAGPAAVHDRLAGSPGGFGPVPQGSAAVGGSTPHQPPASGVGHHPPGGGESPSDQPPESTAPPTPEPTPVAEPVPTAEPAPIAATGTERGSGSSSGHSIAATSSEGESSPGTGDSTPGHSGNESHGTGAGPSADSSHGPGSSHSAGSTHGVSSPSNPSSSHGKSGAVHHSSQPPSPPSAPTPTAAAPGGGPPPGAPGANGKGKGKAGF